MTRTELAGCVFHNPSLAASGCGTRAELRGDDATTPFFARFQSCGFLPIRAFRSHRSMQHLQHFRRYTKPLERAAT